MSCKPYTTRDKWVIALMGGLLFLIFASPYTYFLTGKTGQTLGVNLSNYDADGNNDNTPNGCPTLLGLMVHAFVFLLVARLLLAIGNDGACTGGTMNKDKWMAAVIAAVLFFLLASPFLFSATDKLAQCIGWHTTNGSGCPNLGGLILHAVIFVIIIRILMR